MRLIAPAFLASVDETGATILLRGRSRIRLPSPQAAEMCLSMLAAFGPPGLNPDEWVARFPAAIAGHIADLVGQMRSSGFLVPEASMDNDPEAVFWSDYGHTMASIREAAARIDLTIVGQNRLSAEVARALNRTGVPVSRFVDDPFLRGPAVGHQDDVAWIPSSGFIMPDTPNRSVRLIVACTDIGAETRLRPWNAFCIANAVHFLPVSIKDGQISLGPYVRPRETACFECARGRVNSNAFAVNRTDEETRHEQPGAFGWHPILIDTAAALTASEIMRQALGALAPLPSDLVLADPMGRGTQSRHRVLRLPRCPVCSPLVKHAAPLVVDSESRNAELVAAFK